MKQRKPLIPKDQDKVTDLLKEYIVWFLMIFAIVFSLVTLFGFPL